MKNQDTAQRNKLTKWIMRAQTAQRRVDELAAIIMAEVETSKGWPWQERLLLSYATQARCDLELLLRQLRSFRR